MCSWPAYVHSELACPDTATNHGHAARRAPDVLTLLPMSECIDAMTDALRTLALGRRDAAAASGRAHARRPQRVRAHARRRSSEPSALGAKVITVFPGNDATPYDSHQGAVLLFDTRVRSSDRDHRREHGHRASHGRRHRSRDARCSRAPNRERSRCSAPACRPRRISSRSASFARSTTFASGVGRATARATSPSVVGVQRREDHRVCDTARDAVDGADIVCTVTSSREPVLFGDWLAPGTHVNAVGASLATSRELDSAAVVKSRLFVDRRESAVNEGGDFLVPKREGLDWRRPHRRRDR